MDRVSQYRLYELGQRLSVLRTLDKDRPVASYTLDFVLARWELQSLLSSPLGVRFSRKAIESLVQALHELIPKNAGGAYEGEEVLGYRAGSLKISLDQLEAVIKAELDSLASYVVSQKGAYSTPDLVEQAENMIPEKARNLLPASVIKDVQEAGRCLAFDLPTASGFHILRAVELVMHELWKHVRVSGDKKPTNWGGYIDKFENTGIEKKVTTMLRNLKDLYRNPTAHPEDTLEEEEAITLLSLGVSAIQQMVVQFPGVQAGPGV